MLVYVCIGVGVWSGWQVNSVLRVRARVCVAQVPRELSRGALAACCWVLMHGMVPTCGSRVYLKRFLLWAVVGSRFHVSSALRWCGSISVKNIKYFRFISGYTFQMWTYIFVCFNIFWECFIFNLRTHAWNKSLSFRPNRLRHSLRHRAKQGGIRSPSFKYILRIHVF